MKQFDFSRIHGSNVVKIGMKILNSEPLEAGDIILFPMYYRIRFNNQPIGDLYRELQEIQSYTCCKDFAKNPTNT
jgi:hypothetical protein